MKYVWILFFITTTIRTINRAYKSDKQPELEPDFLDCLGFIFGIGLFIILIIYLTVNYW